MQTQVHGRSRPQKEDFNQALLAKLAWEVQKNEDKHWVKIFKRKYLRGGSFSNTRPPKQASWICKSLFSCNKLIKKGMCYKVGDGRSINIWDDPWVPKEPNFRTKLKTGVAPNNLLVVELIHHDSRQWDREKIFYLFETRSAIRILNIHILASSKRDTLCWGLSPSSEFTVKSAYMLKMQQSSTSLGPMHEEYWKMLWKSKMHERLKLLLWRIVCKSLSVREILSKRFSIPNIRGPVYGEEVETVEHVFIRCPITIQAWANSIWPLNMDVFKDINIDQ